VIGISFVEGKVADPMRTLRGQGGEFVCTFLIDDALLVENELLEPFWPVAAEERDWRQRVVRGHLLRFVAE
jgi:hypothetical protein